MCTFIHYLYEDRTSLRHLSPCHFLLLCTPVMYMHWTVEVFRHTLLFTPHRVVTLVDFFRYFNTSWIRHVLLAFRWTFQLFVDVGLQMQ